MSFPLHYEGAPQRRLYMPEWYLTLVKPDEEMPKNYVRFHIPADMTKYDLKEYLSKIYDVKILSITLETVGYQKYAQPTPWKKEGFEWKLFDPYHVAHIYLANGETFEFPNFLQNAEGKNENSFVEYYEKVMKQNEDYSKSLQNQKHLFQNRWLQ